MDVGVDFTIIGPKVPLSLLPLSSLSSAPPQATANVKLHLQKKIRGKHVRPGKSDQYTEMLHTGKDIIQSILDNATILIPAVINPQGRWGGMFHTFLFNQTIPDPTISFNSLQSAGKKIYKRATTHPRPTGIFHLTSKH